VYGGATLRVTVATAVDTCCPGWSDVSEAATRNKTRTGKEYNIINNYYSFDSTTLNLAQVFVKF
jgi:hypothetical protein